MNDDLEFFKKDENNLLIVDTLNYAFKYKHKGTKNFSHFFTTDMRSFSNSYSAKDTVLLGDGGSAYRKGLYPEYKANRTYSDSEREEFLMFLDEYNLALELSEYPVIKFRGIEADDIAAYLVDTYKDKYDNIWLLSTDRDWNLLLCENVHQFSYTNRLEIKKDMYELKYGYPLDMHISIKVLSGDSGDNIAGVEGIGPKRAYNLVRKYGSAYDVYAALPINSHLKFMQELNRSKDMILLNYRLMDLLETYVDAIGDDNINKIEEKLNWTK